MPQPSDTPPNSNPAISAYESFARETPLVTRYIIQALVVGYLTTFIYNFTSAVVNIPFFTLYRLEIYRLLFAPFFSDNILTVLFSCIAFSTYGKLIEVNKGSTNFGVLIFMIGFLSNVAFLFLCIFLSITTHENNWLTLKSAGPFTIIPGLMAFECSIAPAGSKRRLLMCELQTVYFPVVITSLWFLFSGDNFVLFISMGFGYLYGFGRLKSLRPTQSRRKNWESTWLRNFTTRPGWVVGSNMEDDQWLPLHGPQNTTPTQSVAPTSSSVKSTPAFPITGGRKLGGESTQRRSPKPTTESIRETALAAAERRAAEAESQRDVGKNEP